MQWWHLGSWQNYVGCPCWIGKLDYASVHSPPNTLVSVSFPSVAFRSGVTAKSFFLRYYRSISTISPFFAAAAWLSRFLSWARELCWAAENPLVCSLIPKRGVSDLPFVTVALDITGTRRGNQSCILLFCQ